jgi:hypothetical protein
MALEWKSYRIEKPHQYKTLAPGQGDYIFDYQIPDNHVGFIQYVGSNYYPGYWARWYIDEEDVEGKIEREIGNVAYPMELNPPIVFRKSIKVYAYNGDNVTQKLEWLADGLVYFKG